MEYGKMPIVIGRADVNHIPGTYCLYLPISMVGSEEIRLPEKYSQLSKLINMCLRDFGCHRDFYVYLSFETSYVKPGKPQKRPGWHTDGFKTDDINYIWHSDFPTIFNRSLFDITLDHKVSMEQFEEQADPDNDFTYDNGCVIKMDQYVVHRAATPYKDGVRTFIKLSVSKDKYNLKGNSHNDLFHYEWEMHDRSLVRNHPQYKEVDSLPDGVKL